MKIYRIISSIIISSILVAITSVIISNILQLYFNKSNEILDQCKVSKYKTDADVVRAFYEKHISQKMVLFHPTKWGTGTIPSDHFDVKSVSDSNNRTLMFTSFDDFLTDNGKNIDVVFHNPEMRKKYGMGGMTIAIHPRYRIDESTIGIIYQTTVSPPVPYDCKYIPFDSCGNFYNDCIF